VHLGMGAAKDAQKPANNGRPPALSPIRTLTVGPGLSPGQPADMKSTGSRAYQGF
jgi:hypothetical protein